MAENNNLVVMTFEGMATAGVVYDQIEELEQQKLVTIADAVILERDDRVSPEGLRPITSGSGQAGGAAPVTSSADDHVRIVQTHTKKGKYAAGGSGIGLLAGFLLGGPVGGLVVGAGIGAITGALKDFGIKNDTIDAIKARLVPNSSALLLLGQVQDKDAFLAKLRSFDPHVVSTTLAPEVEKELRARLSE